MTTPPIKSQGIKTKLVPWINDLILRSGVSFDAKWIEPFFGTGVVGFNAPLRGKHFVGDTNPHVIGFYKSVQAGVVSSHSMRAYLESESRALAESAEDGYVHFREVRDRFNNSHDPHDFIFLSRAGFNGLMRFNRHGDWNVPFCKKQGRFSPAYITKICNQIADVAGIIRKSDWQFSNVAFDETIAHAGDGDLIYCDPPYFGRYSDYYNAWTDDDEHRLFEALSRTKAKFILSTWHHNDYRANGMLACYWKNFNVTTREHFYHNGGKLENRHSIVEALVYNFEIKDRIAAEPLRQLELFAQTA